MKIAVWTVGMPVSALVSIYVVIETAQLVWGFMQYVVPGAVS